MVKKNNLAILGCLLISANGVAHGPGGPNIGSSVRLDSESQKKSELESWVDDLFALFMRAPEVSARVDAEKERQAHMRIRQEPAEGYYWNPVDKDDVERLMRSIASLHDTSRDIPLLTQLTAMNQFASQLHSEYKNNVALGHQKSVGALEDQKENADNLYKMGKSAAERARAVYTDYTKKTQINNFLSAFEAYKNRRVEVHLAAYNVAKKKLYPTR